MAGVAVVIAQVLSLGLTSWRQPSCTCVCQGDPSDKVLALLGEQLSRCGPENLSRHCPPALPTQWLPGVYICLLLIAAGFVAGAAAATLGIERSIERRAGAPASAHVVAAPRLALALAAESDLPERGPLTPAAKRATASPPQYGRSGV
jgi:hypothetical protein